MSAESTGIDDTAKPISGDPAEAVPDGDVPGQHQFGPGVERFDEAVDGWMERFRGNVVIDRVFTSASYVAEFSLIWQAINIALGIANRRPRRIFGFAALIGLESLIVNQGIKRMFKRSRPTTSGDSGLHVRKPLTSSFPSGHASAAAFAAGMLAPRAGWPFSALIRAAAATVAASRAYVRIHHASDVVAGLATGALLAAAARRIVERLGRTELI